MALPLGHRRAHTFYQDEKVWASEQKILGMAYPFAGALYAVTLIFNRNPVSVLVPNDSISDIAMPRPVPALTTERQSIPSAPSSHSSLIHDASLSSTQIFSEQVASVLHHTSSSFLKRRLSQKIQDQVSKLPYNTLKNCDSSSLISECSPIEISEQDVIDCDAFAKRAGSQWEKVLRQRGYTEFADVVHNFLNMGRFLEMLDDKKCAQTAELRVADEETNRVDDLRGKFITLYAALNSLRRHQPECDGTGDPLKHIPSLSDCISGTSSARKVIQQIDLMMQSIDSKDLRATYGYDWNAIEEAVKQNKKRLYMFQPSDKGEEYEVVPKSYDGDRAEGSGDICNADDFQPKEKVVGFKVGSNDNCEAVDADFLIARHSLTARVLKRKRKREELNVADGMENGSENADERGRQPSTVEYEQWDLDDIMNAIPVSERRQLIRAAIHPQFPPVENESNNKTDDGENSSDDHNHSAVVCGALRSFGSTHLWEQTLNFYPKDEQLEALENETQQHESQRLNRLQKRALRRAIKERTAPRTLLLSDMRSEYLDKNNKSKTKWTEYCKENGIKGKDEEQMTYLGSNREDGVHHQQLAKSPTDAEQQPYHCLEMDLGQCTVELSNENHDAGETSAEAGTTRMLAFRSLELALRF